MEELRSWRQWAEMLYAEGNKITDIAEHVGRSRRTVGQYLRSLSHWPQLDFEHHEARKKMRQDYQREWDRTKRKPRPQNPVPYDAIRRQHASDVRVLSAEIRSYDRTTRM